MGKKEMILPEIGKTYAVYDDGKIRFSRLEFCKVTEIITWNKASQELKVRLINEARECDWLYNPFTPYFIKAVSERDNHEFYLVWAKRNFWFDVDETWKNMGELDVDGELTKWLLSEIGNMNDDVPIDYKKDIEKLQEIYNIDFP